MNLDTLNTIIALVIVLLVLSLIVQAVQAFIKKLLKLKSRQIRASLIDLYKQAIAAPSAVAPAGAATSNAEEFTGKIFEQFKKVGRVTKFGNPVLESLSKGDLFKIMGKLETENFFPTYIAQFQMLCDEVGSLRVAIESLASNPLLQGAASSKLAEMRSVLAPVFNDVQAVLDENKKVKAKVVFGDLLRLGKLNVSDVLELLNAAQLATTQEIEVASKTSPPGPIADLRKLSDELTKLAKGVGDLSQKFDDAIAPLRVKIEQVETWYDTVMQSFDERYTRHMKSVAIYISIVIVILLNANFFKVYRSISTNPVQKDLIVQSGSKVLDMARKVGSTPSPTATPTPSTPAVTPAPTTKPSPLTSGSANESSTATPTPTPVDIKKEAEETKRDIDVYVSTYEEFGFSPLSMAQARDWIFSLVGRTISRNAEGVPLNKAGKPIPRDCEEAGTGGTANGEGDCSPEWRDQTGGEWWASRRHDVAVLFGWAIMVLLLSVGAPFWQDTLESLFGIKNLLRQRSGTQNVETKSGAGQPRE